MHLSDPGSLLLRAYGYSVDTAGCYDRLLVRSKVLTLSV